MHTHWNGANAHVLTDEERLAALAKAACARSARALAKRRMKEGSVDPVELLTGALKDDETLQRMRLGQFLRACPGVGDRTAEVIMKSMGLGPERTLRSLGSRQRERLSGAVGR